MLKKCKLCQNNPNVNSIHIFIMPSTYCINDHISIKRESEPHTGREAIAPSIIIEIREVQGREETSPDGGVVTPKDVLMKPS